LRHAVARHPQAVVHVMLFWPLVPLPPRHHLAACHGCVVIMNLTDYFAHSTFCCCFTPCSTALRIGGTGQIYNPGDNKYDNEPWLKWLVDVSNTSQIPNVFTMSYQDLEPTLTAA
jgi:hypothetical protein